MYRVEADLDYLYGMSDDACFSGAIYMHEFFGLIPREWGVAVTIKRYKDERDYELRRKCIVVLSYDIRNKIKKDLKRNICFKNICKLKKNSYMVSRPIMYFTL